MVYTDSNPDCFCSNYACPFLHNVSVIQLSHSGVFKNRGLEKKKKLPVGLCSSSSSGCIYSNIYSLIAVRETHKPYAHVYLINLIHVLK